GFAVFAAVFAAASAIAGVGFGWVTALQGSNKIIQWLSLPTLLAEIITWITPLDFDSTLWWARKLCQVALVLILIATWWRFRHSEREAVMGIIIVFVGIVLLSPAALPWYYSW